MVKALGAAALLVAAGVIPGTGTAAEAATAAATCSLDAGTVSASGDHLVRTVFSSKPPRATGAGEYGSGVYAPGQVRLSSSMVARPWPVDGPGAEGSTVTGYVVIGDGLYWTNYVSANNAVTGGSTRIGGGWKNMVALEESDYRGPTQTGVTRRNVYALGSDGVFSRWTVVKGKLQNKGSAAGFGSVKSIALISKTATYDTFLANTRSGALYTIHIPTSSPMKPVVKLVRGTTWQGFEALQTQKCGVNGTILLGIDHDTNSSYLYALGHATGGSTVIKALGKVPANHTFPGPVYFRWKGLGTPLAGE
jgi:hypothetical protein